MADFSAFSWKEAVEVIEQRIPAGRLFIPVVGLLLIVVVLVWGLRFIHEQAVKPIAAWIETRGTGIDQWTALLAIMFVGFASFAGVLVSMNRRAKRWDEVLTRAIQSFVDGRLEPIEARVARLETNTVSLESAQQLEDRLARLEPMPLDVTSITDADEMKRAMLIHMLSKKSDLKPPAGGAKS